MYHNTKNYKSIILFLKVIKEVKQYSKIINSYFFHRRYVEENPEETDEEKQSEQKEVIQATKAQLEEEREREKKLMEQVWITFILQ